MERPFHHGDWWLLPGADLPPDTQLVEGPLVSKQGRATVQLLVHGTVARLPAGARLVEARAQTSYDRKVLRGLERELPKQHDAMLRMGECRAAVASAQLAEHLKPVRQGAGDATALPSDRLLSFCKATAPHGQEEREDKELI